VELAKIHLVFNHVQAMLVVKRLNLASQPKLPQQERNVALLVKNATTV
jgi:hypothetical protein